VRVALVYAHPSPDSFTAHLRDAARGTLSGGGHEVDLIDLYAERFDPVLGSDEWLNRCEGGPNWPEPDQQARRLSAANGLLLVHPTWWGGHPAVLKGWFDRVLGPGVAYPLPGWPAHRRTRGLRHVRRLTVVTTHGSSRLVNGLQGEPGRCTVMRALRTSVHPLARARWLACYGMDRNTSEDRARFVARVQRHLGAW
jgi:putative NADPH-quinone reductase